jgi:hypothetical protein
LGLNAFGDSEGLRTLICVHGPRLNGYLAQKRPVQSSSAAERWAAFLAGDVQRAWFEQLVKSWFRTYERAGLEQLPVTEHFLPVAGMRTLVALLTVPENELFPESD